MKAIRNKICHMHDLTSREYNDLISFHAVFIKKEQLPANTKRPLINR
ncbi:hypothetical protein BLGI_4998 [Brevibacillus laterosporus GI-9]|nr:hypothetical protein BLGI_4998 [Brevibacillus laterosporus GI-9]